MALVYADRVKETTSSTGTGDLTLSGASAGYQAFSDVLGNGDTCYYTITDGVDWEVGLGTFTAPDTLVRTSVNDSSDSGSKIDWQAGTKEVFITFPAQDAQKLAGVEPNADVTDATNVAAAGAVMDGDFTTNGLMVRTGAGIYSVVTAPSGDVVGTSDAQTLTNKTIDADSNTVSNLEVDNFKSGVVDTDLSSVSGSDDTLASAKAIKAYVDSAIQSAKEALLPVGSIVVLGVNTNPNSLYGFGTWTRIQGRMIVGVSDTDNAFDLDDTGGAKTHTLTISEMPSHNHGLSSVGVFPTTPGYTGWQADVGASGTAVLYRASATTNNTGSGNPHPIMNPYIAKYIWQRVS